MPTGIDIASAEAARRALDAFARHPAAERLDAMTAAIASAFRDAINPPPPQNVWIAPAPAATPKRTVFTQFGPRKRPVKTNPTGGRRGENGHLPRPSTPTRSGPTP